MQGIVAGQRLDGRHGVTVGLRGEEQAGAHRVAIQEDGAGPADAVLAAEVRSREAELLAKEVGERHADGDRPFVQTAVTVTEIARVSGIAGPL